MDANWTYKDIDNFYDRVRMALGAVSEISLPDEYIMFPEKAPFAEKTIKLRVPHWKDLSDDKIPIFESAIVYMTASLFEGYVMTKHVKKQEIPTITLEYENINLDVGGLSLKDIIELLIAELLDEVGSDFIGFRVTKSPSEVFYRCNRNIYC